MFTGIVQETGVVTGVKSSAKAIELTLRVRGIARGLKRGGSVSVNGCCLTGTKIFTRGRNKFIQFDLLRETWRRTNLQFLETGALVNLERPLRADGELGGHFVTGHVDGVGKILRWEKSGADHFLEVAAPADVLRYVVFKGSIAVDGISLTIAAARKKSFCVWIIPHTLDTTVLRERQVGAAVNLEADLLGKYAEKFLRNR